MTSDGIEEGGHLKEKSSTMSAAVDHHGEDLPTLSKSAKKMRMDRLLSAPMPSFDRKVPGSFFWSNVAYWVSRRILAVQFRTTEVTGIDTLPLDRGNLCCAWHTNGLLDALHIVLQHPNHFVMGGRHDLVTRPLLGWWTRKLAVQPVVRKAELLRGGCSEEEATQINGRSLMMLATGISAGFGCVLFPEGTSHHDSSMLRFRTGPFRTVYAAAALAKADNKLLPAVIPTGLHFRRRDHFRTDVWVEYGLPHTMQAEEIPDDLVQAVAQGNWVEPAAENVYALRDALRLKLVQLTPNTRDWDEHNALHILAHVEARRAKQPLLSWREEVEAARAFRTLLQPPQSDEQTVKNSELPAITHSSITPAKAASGLLQSRQLDGRDLNATGTDLRKVRPLRSIPKLVRLPFLVALLPLFLFCFTPQLAVGRLLGDSTDEGVDARTSYHFLAAMFGSLMFWPFMALGALGIEHMYHGSVESLLGFDWYSIYGSTFLHKTAAMVTFLFALLPFFWLSGRTSALLWDDWCDFQRAIRRLRFNKTSRQNLRGALKNIHAEMNQL